MLFIYVNVVYLRQCALNYDLRTLWGVHFGIYKNSKFFPRFFNTILISSARSEFYNY